MQKVSPFLWFDGKAEEAALFYTSVFPDSKIVHMSRFGESGDVLVAAFELFGQRFTALNGGPMYGFTPAISFYVDCEDQAEVDDYWSKLTADGGEEDPCGWLRDKFGVSWQVVPKILPQYLQDEDPEKAGRVMQAMMQMKKIDVATLQRAYDGDETECRRLGPPTLRSAKGR